MEGAAALWLVASRDCTLKWYH